jgi:hypothetical protein
MIEVDVIKINKQSNRCVAIKTMTLDDYKKLKQYKEFQYKAYQIGFHAFKIEKL